MERRWLSDSLAAMCDTGGFQKNQRTESRQALAFTCILSDMKTARYQGLLKTVSHKGLLKPLGRDEYLHMLE